MLMANCLSCCGNLFLPARRQCVTLFDLAEDSEMNPKYETVLPL
jgi:hypothetical protein